MSNEISGNRKSAVQFKRLRIGSTGAPSTGVTIESNAGSIKINGVTLTDAELAKLDGLTGFPVQAQMLSFTETTGAGTYTGSVTVPAGAVITDIKVWSTVLWTATTSATMKVGDAGDDDGWFVGVNLKATDLLVGEELNFVQTGGKEGAYLSTTTGLRSAAYSASARVISGVITAVGAAGNAGRSFMAVLYTLPTVSAATKA